MADEICPPHAPGGAALDWSFGPVPRGQTPADFAGGRVSLSWSPHGLHFSARFEDYEVITRARQSGERLWELGDVMEIFVGPADADAYLELHVAPNGCTLQLAWPSPTVVAGMRARGETDIGPFLRSEPLFQAGARTVADGWVAEGLVFARAMAGLSDGGFVSGARFRASFSRYDYGQDGEPYRLSSTSDHPVADFHRVAEWRTLVLGGGFP